MDIIFNAKIYTLDQEKPQASALAIENGKIIALGENNTLDSGNINRRYDAQGKTIIPGLQDAHVHLEKYSLSLQKINCETPTKKECLQRIAERVRRTPPGEWILGHGWNQNNWEEGYGTCQELDAIAPQNPVYLTAKSLHAAWANSSALRSTGIGLNSPDPAGGRVGRDLSGAPNGIFYESAMALIEDSLPVPDEYQVAQAISNSIPNLWKMGLTGVHDFDQSRCFAALQILQRDRKLKLRVLKSIPLPDLPHALALGLRSGYGDDFLRIGGIKIFADGALGPRTAAMFDPYEGEADNLGMLLLDHEEIYELGRNALTGGFSLAIHAIGDRAVHEALNALSQLKEYEDELIQQGKSITATRHRIEHVQIIHPSDTKRLAASGVTASMQPIHAISDMEMADKYWGARAAHSYAWREQLTNGTNLAFGSDAPVDSPNPFWGIHAALTRRRIDGYPASAGWYPEQKLTLQEALRAYTYGPAYVAGIENRVGKLYPGFTADLLLLEKDPFSCDPDELRDVQPLATMVAGEWVYGYF